MSEAERAKNLLLGYISVNINDDVEVRLTDKGRDIYFHKNDEFDRFSPKHFPPASLPKEVDGWFTCQLWELMEIFGDHVAMGTDNPFETNIRIKIDE